MAAPIEENMAFQQTLTELCEIEATVTTGFESLAKEEIQDKFHVDDVTTNRGRVNFHIPVTIARQVLELSSIDNVYVVIKRYTGYKYAETLDETLHQFRAIVPEVDWDLGLRVWSKFFSFAHTISDKPQRGYQGVNAERSDVPSDDENCAAPGDHSSIPSAETADVDGISCMNTKSCGPTEPVQKKVKRTTWNPTMPAFRATCYRSGKHIFQSPEAAANFGGEINNYFGWNVDMKKFDIEAVLTIEQDHVYVSISLTKESLHRRNITKFGPTTLRPTIAYNMLRFCHIKDTEVVCDPMCGGGSIPIEAAINWPNSLHICGDIFDQAPLRTKENLDAVNAKRIENGMKNISATVFKWDASRMPLQDGSVDVFITDMPFGKRSGSRLSNWHLYPKVLKEMARVCKRETGRVCLLTQDKRCLLKSLMPIEGLWRRGPTISINIGGLVAGVFLLHRTARKYLSEEKFKQMQKEKLEKVQNEQKHSDKSDS